MNKNLFEYRVFCNTENDYVTSWGEHPPKSCPNDGTHSIDTSNVVVVSRAPENIFPMTSFEELRVAERTGIIELKSVFGKSPIRDIYTETGTATITNEVGDGEYKLEVLGTNDVAILRSAERGRYVAGLQGEMCIGARLPLALSGEQKVMIGLFDDNNGFYFEYTADGMYAVVLRAGVESRISRNDFNVDKFDGTGPSKYNLQEVDGIIYTIRFSWYGYGNIEFRLNTSNADDRQSSWLGHVYNPLSQISVKTPNLPLTVKLVNNNTNSPVHMFVAGRTYALLGKYIPITRINAAYRFNISISSTTAFIYMLGIRRKNNFYGNPLTGFSADVYASQDVIVQFRVQATLTNPSFTTPNDTNASDTSVEVDFSASAFANGRPIWTGLVSGSRTSSASTLDIQYNLSESDILVVLAKAVSATNGSANVCFRWREEW